MSKEIACPKCGHVWLWADWKKDKDAFCPKGYGCAIEEAMQELSDISQKMEEYNKEVDIEMDEWWNDLSKEEQMKAFYSVVKRLVDGELVQKGSYRYVLYQVFGFEPESYYLGMQCGFMSLHNSIERDVEKFT